jgi:osmotically-inducible protein OsmY
MMLTQFAISGDFDTVRRPGSAPTEYAQVDAVIRTAVAAALGVAATRFAGVSALVSHGWVTLSGAVSSTEDKVLAESIVCNIVDVRGVTNRISIRPEVDIDVIRNTVSATLVRGALQDARDVIADIDSGHVTLRGSVQNWRDYEALEQTLKLIPGVVSVTNGLVVNLRKHMSTRRDQP